MTLYDCDLHVNRFSVMTSDDYLCIYESSPQLAATNHGDGVMSRNYMDYIKVTNLCLSRRNANQVHFVELMGVCL